QWATTVSLPRSLSNQGDRIHLDLFADGKPVASKGHVDLQVTALPRPRFAYDTTLTDLEGNGDGLIQRGERIALSVHVTNVGEGAAEDTLMTIKNESGESVYIEQGRHKGGAIAPGQTHTATFVLKVRETLTSQDVQLKVGLADQALRTWARDDLSLPVFPAAYPVAEAADARGAIEGGPVQAHNGPHRDAAPIAILGRGTVVPIVARAGDWVQVRLAEADTTRAEWLGWAPARALKTTDKPVKCEPITRAYEYEPPAIDLEASSLSSLHTDAKTWTLSGTARFAGAGRDRRHVVAFRGNDKVFFRSAQAEPDARGDLAFSTEIALNPGRNVIRILAREGQDDVTGRTVIVYRR
ncbi:MAG: hypothetical protein QF464_07810, partial [Myxococcota bacterium]|nr:hypothetical protein [Myxococcota bacterium]